jgi:hypothetical protein
VISGTTHKTVKRVIARHEAGGGAPERVPRGHNYDGVAVLVAERFCAVLAWCRFRFVRFAADERAATTLAMLAECFEVPGTVLADRMGCLKGGVVANVVVPAPEYLRFAAHYGFRPDFCQAADPESNAYAEGSCSPPGPRSPTGC